METMGDRIRRLRKEHGLSQKGLGGVVGVTQQLIGQIENGENRGSAHIARIAAALGVNPLWLETGEGRKEADPTATLSPLERRFLDALAKLPPQQRQAELRALEARVAVSDETSDQ